MTKRIKRLVVRPIAIVLALCAGWLIADAAFDQVPDGPLTSTAYAATAPAQGASGKHDHDHMGSIESLQPGAERSWHRWVVGCAVLLFVLAVPIGLLALALKAPEPPERDASHGHDAHAPAAHGGHGH